MAENQGSNSIYSAADFLCHDLKQIKASNEIQPSPPCLSMRQDSVNGFLEQITSLERPQHLHVGRQLLILLALIGLRR